MAGKAKQVYGVEIVPEAIADAKKNAEIIVVDPPRKGCDEALLNTIVTMAPKRVVYVSCDPATLARDLRYLCDRGFEVKKLQAVDQFSHTTHVESIILLKRRNI